MEKIVDPDIGEILSKEKVVEQELKFKVPIVAEASSQETGKKQTSRV